MTRRMWGHLVREPSRPSRAIDALNAPLSSRAGHRLHRTVEAIERDIKYWRAQSAACEWCSGGCWCDGDWSPEARLLELGDELAEAEKRGRHRR